MFKEFWNGLMDVTNDILNAILFMLPNSPFADVEIPQEVYQILGYVNYFIPIRAMLAIGASWLAAIGVYYLFQVGLRYVKAIK